LTASRSTWNAALTVPLARISLLAGDHAAARRLGAEVFWLPSTPERERLELLLIAAQASHRMGDHDSAGQLVRHALVLHERAELLRPFGTLPPDELAALLGLGEQRLSAAEL